MCTSNPAELTDIEDDPLSTDAVHVDLVDEFGEEIVELGIE